LKGQINSTLFYSKAHLRATNLCPKPVSFKTMNLESKNSGMIELASPRMPKSYGYVGPPAILARTMSAPKGAPIRCTADLRSWIKATLKKPDSQIISTYVIDTNGVLLIADRRSEHVACAGGKPVLSAGEMTFLACGDELEVIQVSNQSTGYCPEPESWPQVALALDRIPIPHPDRFAQETLFRRCNSCGQINIVKDNWLVCSFCEKELPKQWNLA